MAKILVFGDSLAAGLASYMNSSGISVTNGGKTGESVGAAAKRASNYKGYDTIIVQTTTNNTDSASISLL